MVEAYDDRLRALEQIKAARQYTTFQTAVDNLSAEDLRDEQYVEELVGQTEQYPESRDVDTLRQQLAQDISADIPKEAYWLIPVLGQAVTQYEDSYTNILTDIRPLTELVIASQGLELADTPLDELNETDDIAPKFTWSHGGERRDRDLYRITNLKKSNVQIADSRFHGESLFRNTENLSVYGSYLTGDNLLKNTKQLQVVESVLEGENLLRTSTYVDITSSALYGDETLKQVEEYDIVDSIILGEEPLALETPKEEGYRRVTNSIIAGKQPLKDNDGAVIVNSLVVGTEEPRSTYAHLTNSFVVTPDEIHYYDSDQLRRPSKTVSFTPEGLQDLFDDIEV